MKSKKHKFVVIVCPKDEQEYIKTKHTYDEKIEAVYHSRKLTEETGIKHRVHIMEIL